MQSSRTASMVSKLTIAGFRGTGACEKKCTDSGSTDKEALLVPPY